ncbi:hypothetical protein ACUOGR_24375, partial [Escherichia coli]
MTPLFKKLNLGTARLIHVLDAPASFEAELGGLQGVEIRREVLGGVAFALAFVRTLAEVERAAQRLTGHVVDDPMLWMAYPKASSKRYRCAFT